MVALYKALADSVIDSIQSGKLKVGAKMPSIRQFKDQHQVSKTTALNCYYLLQEQGWLQSKPQSGFYTSLPWGEQRLPLYPKFEAMITKPRLPRFSMGERDAPFYASQLAPELIPLELLNRCFKRANCRSDNGINLYPQAQGNPKLIRSLSQHFSQHYFPISESIVITNGCIDAVCTAIEVTTKVGDAIAITSPCFNGLLELLANLQRMVVEIPSHNGELDLDQLEHHMKTGTIKACLMSSNHINPQGLVLTVQQKQVLAKLATQYQVAIIEDDVFLELSYTKNNPLPIKHWDKKGWVLWCGSVSKTLSPSYRIGWCEPGRFFNQYLAQRQVKFYGVSQPVQNTLHEFINSGLYLKHLNKLRLTLAQQARDYYQFLQQHLPTTARLSTALGGMVIWIQVPKLNSQKLFNTAKEQGIFFRPGKEFSSRNLYNDCFRINTGWPISLSSNANTQKEQVDNRRDELKKLCNLVIQQCE
ncbi:aminotransferase-like domain-containing protein [Spartinivicinus ruber]|uniref:aminotransferase-like domain-containing protein n=1 Tax=Spartinivicinus ruber TaxID=2683272 RepID=UPI0013D34DB1|nr:PLP-dependent aminotransferase family protein [Spartinivicinus ruber]